MPLTQFSIIASIATAKKKPLFKAKEFYVAAPKGRDTQSVRTFLTFTADIHRLADWLAQCRVKTVALESTGVYWIPLYEILEQHGFEVYLVNARHLKNVSGRKSDVLDCQWLQQLHTYGVVVKSQVTVLNANFANGRMPRIFQKIWRNSSNSRHSR